MGRIEIASINVDKDTDTKKYRTDFMVDDIISALQDMQEDATIIRIEHYEGTQKEKLAIIRNICDAYDNLPGSFVICADAHVSAKEFPLEKYYDPEFYNPKEGKKTLPFKEVIDRERKMLEEIGFESINAVVQYSSRDAMIYTNDIGKKLITYWFGETINRKRG